MPIKTLPSSTLPGGVPSPTFPGRGSQSFLSQEAPPGPSFSWRTPKPHSPGKKVPHRLSKRVAPLPPSGRWARGLSTNDNFHSEAASSRARWSRTVASTTAGEEGAIHAAGRKTKRQAGRQDTSFRHSRISDRIGIAFCLKSARVGVQIDSNRNRFRFGSDLSG